MDNDQLTRFFACLLRTVPAPDLFKILKYAVRGEHPMARQEQDHASDFTTRTAEMLTAEVARLMAPVGRPTFPPRG